MATLDNLSKKDRKWLKHADKCAGLMMQAASVQARQYGITFKSAADQLAELYNIKEKKEDWRNYGDVAFHIVVTWPADLAYRIIYSLRDSKLKPNYDPIPLIMKALEMLRYLKYQNLNLHLEPNENFYRLANDKLERSKAAAKIIVRELSCVPLRWSIGIYRNIDPEMKSIVAEQMEEYNKDGAKILLSGSWAWLLTGAGILNILLRIPRFFLKLLLGSE